ncbi:MAG: chromate transporter [Pseudomonadota bacterium]
MVSFSEIVRLFLRLGGLGFGGPVALVAMMEQECVVEKKWISRERFEQSFVICKMLPGPLAYQMALWVGYELRGVFGGILAGVAFIFPAATLLFLFAKFYESIQSVQASAWILDGMRVGALVIILQSVGSLFSPYKRKVSAWVYSVIGACLMLLFPRWEPVIILFGGFLSLILIRKWPLFRMKLSAPTLLFALFWVHFKAGAFVFGTGLAIVPVIEREVVGVFHWLSKEEFLDALAFAQVTPGPVTTIAAFIGYKVAGGLGSLAAAFGIYLPGALTILGILPWARQKIEKRSWLSDFQMGAVPTVIGCLVTAAYGLLASALSTSTLVMSFIVLLLVQVVFVLPAWVIIVLGSVLQPILKSAVALIHG